MEEQVKALSIEDKIKELKGDIEVLDLWFTVTSENGVFNTNNRDKNQNNQCKDPKIPSTFEGAQACLKEVWNKLYNAKQIDQNGDTEKDDIVGYCETTLSNILEFYNR